MIKSIRTPDHLDSLPQSSQREGSVAGPFRVEVCMFSPMFQPKHLKKKKLHHALS